MLNDGGSQSSNKNDASRLDNASHFPFEADTNLKNMYLSAMTGYSAHTIYNNSYIKNSTIYNNSYIQNNTIYNNSCIQILLFTIKKK